MPLPAGLDSIPGAQELYDWFGYWPDFHDAEIVKFSLEAAGPSSLVIHTWEMTNRVNEQGYYETTKHAVVNFELNSVVNVSLVDLWEHSILLDFGVDRTEAGFRLSFSAAYGFPEQLSVRDYPCPSRRGSPSTDHGSIMSSPPCHNSMGRDMRRTTSELPDLGNVSLDLKRELFAVLTAEIAHQLNKKRVLEETILRDFESWRTRRVEPSRGR